MPRVRGRKERPGPGAEGDGLWRARRRCDAPGGDGRAVQQQAAFATGNVEHHHIALDGGACCACVGRCEGDEFGDGHLAVHGWHHKQAAAAGQRLNQPFRHLYRNIGQQLDEFGNQQRVGEPGGSLVRVQRKG